jgi:hypothetical protein
MDALIAREYSGQLLPPLDPVVLLNAFVDRWAYLAQEAAGPLIGLGLIGLGFGLRHPATRRAATAIGLVLAAYIFAPTSQALLIGTHLLIMVASLALAAGWGIGLAALQSRHWAIGPLGLAIAALSAIYTMTIHWNQVAVYSQDPLGARIIAAVKTLPEEKPIVLEMWGPRYFTLAYGKLISHELNIELVDGRGGLSNLPQTDRAIYAIQEVLYLYPPDLWSAQMGVAAVIESAGDNLAVIRRAPRLSQAPAVGATDIVIESARAWRDANGDVRLVIEWRCLRPTSTDYHVFAQITDQPQVTRADDILAQGDRSAPVYGFYPTSGWVTNQLVRDDYRIPIPASRVPTLAVVGLYTLSPSGEFSNYLSVTVPIGVKP